LQYGDVDDFSSDAWWYRGQGCSLQRKRGMTMRSRRAAVAGLLALVPFAGRAQGGGFVGNWQGDVPGIGAARLIITAVGADGVIAGRMEFDLQSFVSTFAEKYDSVKNTNRGVVSGSTLTIDAALGGRYELTLDSSRLSGVYTRGTTYRVPVTFTKS
jgi:hypothetical protein